jgi:hypothetical protein
MAYQNCKNCQNYISEATCALHGAFNSFSAPFDPGALDEGIEIPTCWVAMAASYVKIAAYPKSGGKMVVFGVSYLSAEDMMREYYDHMDEYRKRFIPGTAMTFPATEDEYGRFLLHGEFELELKPLLDGLNSEENRPR